jgi:hypothetical protein
MFSMREPRKMKKCRTKRKKGMGNCDQLIYESETETYRSGKHKILNGENGRGGNRDEPHVCPDRLDSEFDHTNRNINWNEYEYHLRHKTCVICLDEFDSIRNPLCSHCFALECRKCGNRQQWINNEREQYKRNKFGQIVLVKDESLPIINNDKCNKCGAIGLDVHQIWNRYQILFGKYDFSKY